MTSLNYLHINTIEYGTEWSYVMFLLQFSIESVTEKCHMDWWVPFGSYCL